MSAKKDTGPVMKRCARCAASFSCRSGEEDSGCWCNRFPPLFVPDPVAGCLCPRCLHQASLEKIREYVASMTPEKALYNNKARELPKSGALLEELDYYIEDGRWVYTAWHHLKRGHCCENGCRHCPYGFKKNQP